MRVLRRKMKRNGKTGVVAYNFINSARGYYSGYGLIYTPSRANAPLRANSAHFDWLLHRNLYPEFEVNGWNGRSWLKEQEKASKVKEYKVHV